MTTTVMRDSVVGDQWIYQTCMNVPIQKVLGDDGQPTGDLLTGPVRLQFHNLFELPKAKEGESAPKYGSALLFSPWADMTLLQEKYNEVVAQKFPQHYDQRSGTYVGLYSPFRQQDEKLNFMGFTPGLIWLSATTKFKPQVVDLRNNPIIDPSKAYSGVWAICSINAYGFADTRKKGVAFGLQSVMIIGDDESLMKGGAPDTGQSFKGALGAIAAPPVQPGAASGMPQGHHAPPPAYAPPAPPPGGTYAAPPAPGGYAPPPPAYAPPPAPGGYTMPGAPPPAADPRGPAPAGYSSWAEYDALMASL